jgi:outer membrane immunogenic protein
MLLDMLPGGVMKKLLLASIALSLLAFPAAAADMKVKAPILKAPPAPYRWTGCYIGANAGWNGSDGTSLLVPTGTYLNPAGVLAPPNAAGTGALPGDQAAVTHNYGSHDSGFTGGGQIGCNLQSDRFVFGAEADFDGSSLSSTTSSSFAPVPSSNPAFTISPETDVVTTKLDWFSTVRGRLGIAFDRVLLYATGGLVVADIRSTTSVTFTTAGTSPVYAGSQQVGSGTTTRAKGVVGAGLEYAIFNNWSVKAEYLYFDLGTMSYLSPLVAPTGVAPGYAWSTTARLREHIARVGLNYKFDSSGLLATRH